MLNKATVPMQIMISRFPECTAKNDLTIAINFFMVYSSCLNQEPNICPKSTIKIEGKGKASTRAILLYSLLL